MDEHLGDIEHRENLARALGACRIAVAKLECYYAEGLPDVSPPRRRKDTVAELLVPQYTTYNMLDREGKEVPGPVMTLTYKRSYTELSGSGKGVQSKLVFEAFDNDGNHLCVKFVKRYGKKAHIQFAQNQLAPDLKGFREIGGGWKMVVMEYLSEPYKQGEELRYYEQISSDIQQAARNMLKQRLQVVHHLGYVHGDIRNPNLMLALNGSGSLVDLKLVDFDWAGKEGEVRYPHNMNLDLIRARGAKSSANITAKHDIFMVDTLFKCGLEEEMDVDAV
jgi:serine/threonine protein kinase